MQQEKVYDKIKEKDKLVLLSIIPEADYEIAKIVIENIKNKYPTIKVGVGGTYPTLVPKDMMANKNIDMVCIGEGEIADVEYAKQVEKGQYHKTDNLWIMDNNGKIIKCDRSVVIEDIDSLPYPERDGWLKGFSEQFKQKQTNQYILLERGCNNKCTYCSQAMLSKKQEGKYLRYRSIDKVIEEIKSLSIHYSYMESIKFIADNALSDPKYFIELCQKLIKFNIDIIYKTKNIFYKLKNKLETDRQNFQKIAKQEMDKGNFKQAIKYFNKVKVKEYNYWIYGDSGIAKMNIRDYKGAIKDFDKVLELEPKEKKKKKREECLEKIEI